MTTTRSTCPKTELLMKDCPHCANHARMPKMRLSTGDIGMPFQARYESVCGNCDGPIHVGDVAALLPDGNSYGCLDCLP